MSAPVHTLQSLADFTYGLQKRCKMRDGSVAGEALLTLTPEDVAALDALRERLDQMVPHAQAIRRVVMGR